jgi:hypothetical protein
MHSATDWASRARATVLGRLEGGCAALSCNRPAIVSMQFFWESARSWRIRRARRAR